MSIVFRVLPLFTGGVQQAIADVNLEWRFSASKLFVGDTIEIGLYAVSDNGTDQTIAGIDAILSWDPNVLELTGLINNGPYDWGASYFPDDSKLDGLNAPFNDGDPVPGNDGDALYQAVIQSGLPATATAEGLLVTTLVFKAVGASPSTELTFLPQLDDPDSFAVTRVISDNPVGKVITGTLGSIFLEILPCGFSGDIDFDCDIDLMDYRHLFPCMAGPNVHIPLTPCSTADLDGDLDVDLHDYSLFQRLFSGS